MNEQTVSDIKKNVIAIGSLLWEKDLVTGLNGNISARVDTERMVITARKTCLGLLHENDIVLMNLSGEVLEEGEPSSERPLHIEIYKNFPQVKAVIHTHTTYTNAYFLERDRFTPRIFESKFYLGEVKALPQATPSVTDVQPVVEALRGNSIIVLKGHGVVSMGDGLFDCFLFIQGLEEAIKIEALSCLFMLKTETPAARGLLVHPAPAVQTSHPEPKWEKGKRYKLFSQEQIAEIVQLVNNDTVLKDLGEKSNMTMDLAIKLNENGQVYCFRFENGKINSVSQDENAEFLISAPQSVWRAVFNREIDPFVATTQKKMNLRGDFAKISRWYAPCSRIFELWQNVPVED